MLERINKPFREDFASSFMASYVSPGLNIPLIRIAYGKRFEIIELRSNYKVTVGKRVKRSSSLFVIGEFVYDNTFEIGYVYTRNLPLKQARRIESVKRTISNFWLDRMIQCLKQRINILENC